MKLLLITFIHLPILYTFSLSGFILHKSMHVSGFYYECTGHLQRNNTAVPTGMTLYYDTSIP